MGSSPASGSRPWVGVVSLLAGLLSAAALAPGAAAADPAVELARRYAPVVRLVEQTEPCAHGEPYQPTDATVLLGNPGVALRGPWDGTNVVKVAPTARDLAKGLFDYHLDFPGNALSPGCTYDEWSHRITTGSRPTTYARVVTEPSRSGELALQYWFFYVFNDFNDKHEGDWEMIQLDFRSGTAVEALAADPFEVGYSQHEGAERARWGDEKLELVDDTHPVVYPALGSHANYYASKLYLGRSAAQGVGCDDTAGPSRELRPAVELVPARRTAYLRSFPWLGYLGRWGERHGGFYNGPTGPNTKRQWTAPITWASERWRDASYTVPAGGALGHTATGFFCGAVAAGSTVLTALVGNPSPVLLALAATLALLLWLASRTRWDVSSPFRVRRRRPWGSLVTSALRLYAGHPRLFLGIGLLFLPLGLVISGVQYLLFRHGGTLAPLVASAGASNAVVGRARARPALHRPRAQRRPGRDRSGRRRAGRGQGGRRPRRIRARAAQAPAPARRARGRGPRRRSPRPDRRRIRPRRLARDPLVAAAARRRAGREPLAPASAQRQARARALVARGLDHALRHRDRPAARAADRDAPALRDQRVLRLRQPRVGSGLRRRASVRRDHHHVPLLRPPRRRATRDRRRRLGGRPPGRDLNRPHRRGRQEQHRPRDRRLRLEDVRDLPRRPAALHDLLEPRVVRDVPEAVGEHQRDVCPRRLSQPRARDPVDSAEEDQGRDGEQGAAQAVVVAVVDARAVVAGDGRRVAGAEEPAEERDAVEEEAELRGEPRDRDEGDGDRNEDRRPSQRTPLAGRPERQHRRRDHPDRRRRVRPLRVEVRLRDDAGPEDGRAEERGRHGEQPLAHDGQDPDRGEREREVQEHHEPRGAAGKAAPVHVVELVRRQARVGDEDRGADGRVERPEQPHVRIVALPGEGAPARG